MSSLRQTLAQARKALLAADSIAVAGHVNPDGDCVGSVLALGMGLRQLGKKVTMIMHEGVPQSYRDLPGFGLAVRDSRARVDVAVAVDCNDSRMLGSARGVFRRAGTVIEIDHHRYHRSFGDIGLIDSSAAAVGELVAVVLKSLKVRVNSAIAENILTSIIVETNSFRLPRVRPLTFQVCADMLSTGVDFTRLTHMVYWTKTRAASILTGVCLARSRFLKGGRIIWSVVRKSDFRRTQGRDEDVDAVADEMRAVKGVLVAVLFRERDTGFRVSLRSKEQITVASLAGRHGGGGHDDVAGCMIPKGRSSIRTFLREVGRILSP